MTIFAGKLLENHAPSKKIVRSKYFLQFDVDQYGFCRKIFGLIL